MGLIQHLEKEDIKDFNIERAYTAYQDIKPYLETVRGSLTIKKAMEEVERIYIKHVKAYENTPKPKKTKK